MELVSANTKNYLFLTLTQNNDADELVRARVSMRRDQAFWEGGNSFIACESFRITSAPNEGGLYYNVVPQDFVMEATKNTGKPPDPATANVVHQIGHGPPGLRSIGVNRDAGKLIGTTVKVKKNPAAGQPDMLTATLRVCSNIHDANNPIPGIHESAFEDLVPRLARYFGTNRIGKGSIVRLTDVHLPAPQSVDVQLTQDPALHFTGPGLGVNGMFVPSVSFPEAVADFAKLAAGHNDDYMLGCTLEISGGEYGTVSSYTQDQVHTLFGRDCFITASGGLPIAQGDPQYPGNYVEPFFNQAAFEVMAPTGMQVSIANSVNQYGEFVNAIMWDTSAPLKVGDRVSMNVGGHMKTGRVIHPGSAPSYIKDNKYQWVVDVRMTGNMLNGNPPLTAAYMANNAWCMSSEDRPIETFGYGVDIVGNIVSAANVIEDSAPTVSLMELQHASTMSISRGYEQRMIFTPNELFDMFNIKGNVSDTTLTPPWLLQTDENGGFCVKWTQDATNPSTQFFISKPMCDSLGLNPFMTFEQLYPRKSTTHTVTLLHPAYRRLVDDDRVNFASYLHDVDSGDVSLSDGSKLIPVTIPAGHQGNPPQINPNWTMMDSVIYKDREYLILSVQTQQNDISESFSQRLLPHVVTHLGIETYLYTNLPEIGQISNTGQVSVESWGTFSMINLVIPNIPFQSMLGGESDSRILASLRLPFNYSTVNGPTGAVKSTEFDYYGDLLYNSDSSRSYLRITTDQQLFDCDVEARLIRRDGSMEIMQIPYKGQFQVKLRLLQTQ